MLAETASFAIGDWDSVFKLEFSKLTILVSNAEVENSFLKETSTLEEKYFQELMKASKKIHTQVLIHDRPETAMWLFIDYFLVFIQILTIETTSLRD